MIKKLKKGILEDKRIIALYVIVIVALIIGLTYALSGSSLAFNIGTGIIQLDTEAYGDTSFNSSNIDFSPILDSNVETSINNIIKIDFTVGGNANNTSNDIIYDIALNDLNVSCDLLSPYIKWKLVKNSSVISTGSLDYRFDTITDGRLVLTTIQQDLAPYSSTQAGYDDYSFYMWFSDSCQSDPLTCVNNGIVDQSNMMGKLLKGKIEVELYTGSKKTLTRNPSNTLNNNTCSNRTYLNTMNVGDYVAYTGNNGCSDAACSGQNANYVNEDNKGYCEDSSYKYTVSGWRIAYIKSSKAHLISAGAPECSSTQGFMTNVIALKYCNINFVDGNCTCNDNDDDGYCDIPSTDTWSMSVEDYYEMTAFINNGQGMTPNSCDNVESAECGINSDLLNVGSFYRAASDDVYGWFHWNPYYGSFSGDAYNAGNLGIRPIISLSATVYVTGGSGAANDPYTIGN